MRILQPVLWVRWKRAELGAKLGAVLGWAARVKSIVMEGGVDRPPYTCCGKAGGNNIRGTVWFVVYN